MSACLTAISIIVTATFIGVALTALSNYLRDDKLVQLDQEDKHD